MLHIICVSIMCHCFVMSIVFDSYSILLFNTQSMWILLFGTIYREKVYSLSTVTMKHANIDDNCELLKVYT